MDVIRVDKQLFWNVKVGDECVGWVKVEGYKLVFNPAINSFAPELTYSQRSDAIYAARKELTHMEILSIECGGDLDLKDFIAQFLSEGGIDDDEANEQAVAMIKGLKEKWNIRN